MIYLNAILIVFCSLAAGDRFRTGGIKDPNAWMLLVVGVLPNYLVVTGTL